VTTEGLFVPHVSAGEHKKSSPPPGAVVAFCDSASGHKTADLLTYLLNINTPSCGVHTKYSLSTEHIRLQMT